ncbi:peptidase T [Olsenella sp. Marseille-P4559]|uniref:peptidase T n=1 Tax=Olsenella sp. Marseille-P4559 TaxID=2364795 RepID=UPI00102FF232|nr:peptidase T [Olsenella sp. Marseille-P4559]
MSDVLERFLRYVQVDSPSDPDNEEEVPSSPLEHGMARLLADELMEMGCQDVSVDEHAYVLGTVPASEGAEGLPALCLCSHLDTTTDAPSLGVRPHVVRYEGGGLVAGIVDGQPVVTTPEQVPDLEDFAGQDIVCSDGTTLLGADDKAGVAEICALAARLLANPTIPHPTLRLAFVPDEEIGHGAALLDLEKLGAAWGYTVDGEALGEFNYETFNAAEALVHVYGVMVHPGMAKDVMVNAIALAAEFDQLVPAAERPEHTSGREGFYHPTVIRGTAAEVTLAYIVRDHDAQAFERRQQTLRDIAAFLNERYGEGTVTVTLREQYRNMVEAFGDCPFLIDDALEANREAGVEPAVVAVRGGTDGSQLSLRGLPCPNIATGGYNAHSVREFIPVSSLETTVEILQNLVAKFAVPQKVVR